MLPKEVAPREVVLSRAKGFCDGKRITVNCGECEGSQTVYTTSIPFGCSTLFYLSKVGGYNGFNGFPWFPPWRAAQLGRFPSAPNRLPRSRLLIRPLVHPSSLPHDVRVLLVVVRRPGFRGWHPRESTHLHTSSHIFTYLLISPHVFTHLRLFKVAGMQMFVVSECFGLADTFSAPVGAEGTCRSHS